MRRGLGHPGRPAPERPSPGRAAPGAAAGPEAMTVAEFTRRIKTLLEGRLGAVAVVGEVSGCKASPSGHIYFSLKDSVALLDCVVWRSAALRLRNPPVDGTKVTARGRLSVYEPRGRYQLVVTSLSVDADKGDLWRKFEEVKRRLADEGLFDGDRKIPLPDHPRTIGVVTSPTGAALRDILTIVSRRAPNARVVVSPCLVQGRDAAADIERALAAMDRWGGADVVIVGRGGGSLEDLWPFNEERVARAIATAATPVVSAVGHETDFTIADFVADARAATPSEAAERIVPDESHLRGRVAHAAMMLTRALSGTVRERRQGLLAASRASAYRRPADMFMSKWQRLDEATAELGRSLESCLRRAGSRVELAGARLGGLSPLRVLERGYAVLLDGEGRAVVDASSLAVGDAVAARVRRGKVEAEVKRVIPF